MAQTIVCMQIYFKFIQNAGNSKNGPQKYAFDKNVWSQQICPQK